MNQNLKEKTNEAFRSVLPISAIVILLSTFLAPIQIFVGTVLLVLGMGLFSLGADVAMLPMGDGIGKEVTKIRKMAILVAVCFFAGFIITVAEPDLTVLADQVPDIDNFTLISTVSMGVGLFLVIAVLRIIFHIRLSTMLLVSYALLILLSFFIPKGILGVAFDSGGVTTGPITVPFILSFGIGIASMRSDKDSLDDSFGLVALCSIGPVLAVMILGFIYNPSGATALAPEEEHKIEFLLDVFRYFVRELPSELWNVCFSIIPILLFFLTFQLLSRRYRKRQLIRILIGIAYTLSGLVLFLTGVSVGFIPIGGMLGDHISTGANKWLLIPVGMLIGYFLVAAEPAVHVLNKQVEEITEGAIPQKAMNLALSIGVMVSVGLSMVRILTGISIYWFLIPGYVIALLLTFRVPKMITGIAFDSGGVASGPMTSTFLLPFTIGASTTPSDAFGVVAMVAMTPLIAIQIMGLVYLDKASSSPTEVEMVTAGDDSIMDSIEDPMELDEVLKGRL